MKLLFLSLTYAYSTYCEIHHKCALGVVSLPGLSSTSAKDAKKHPSLLLLAISKSPILNPSVELKVLFQLAVVIIRRQGAHARCKRSLAGAKKVFPLMIARGLRSLQEDLQNFVAFIGITSFIANITSEINRKIFCLTFAMSYPVVYTAQV